MTATLVLTFLGTALLVMLAGVALAHFGDAIGERTKLGGLWVGSILLAGTTSLPELTTDVSAVRLGVPDLAVGDLFGSSMANMLLLSVVDLMPPRNVVLRRATLDHALLACLAIALNALAAIFVLAPTGIALGRVGLESVILLVVYLAGMRAVSRQGARPREGPPASAPTSGHEQPSLRVAIPGFLAAAAVTLAAAPHFAEAAKEIAEATGLGFSFVGTLLVGLSTSLPELVSSIAAVRLKNYDLAVGNLLGSCAFNMIVFAVLDVATPAPVFASISHVHVLTALFAVVLLSLGLAAIVFRAERRFALLEPDSLLVFATYVLALWLLYTRSAGQ